jgi:cell wall assembly regulator SMI1
MGNPYEGLLGQFSGKPGATEEHLQIAERQCGAQLPEDYRRFLMLNNGGEGFIGKHYLILWKVEELHDFNIGYQVNIYAPGFLMFGSSGGGDGFAFDIRTTPYRVMQVPFIGMSSSDAFFVAESFTRLLERMAEIDGPLF